jgi:uncharacterized protein (DUF58 family)
MAKKHKKKINVKIRPRMRVLNRALEGNWNTIFKGRGIEFAGYRQYQFGDDASKIDWKASFRTDEILIKELEEYHALNVFFLLDVSNSMICSSTGQLKVEYAAEMIANLAYNIVRSGDAIGVGLFTDKIVSKILPKKGEGMHLKIMEELNNHKNYGGKFDLKHALLLCNSMLEEGTMIIIVSDFIGLEKGWSRYLKILSGKYEIIGMAIHDPRDYCMPKEHGQYLLEDPYEKKVMYIDTGQFSKRYKKEVNKRVNYIKNIFNKSKMGFVYLKTDQDFEKPIVDFFRKRTIMSR